MKSCDMSEKMWLLFFGSDGGKRTPTSIQERADAVDKITPSLHLNLQLKDPDD